MQGFLHLICLCVNVMLHKCPDTCRLLFFVQDGTKDILIFGTKDRNRAFHGDIVAVQIKDKMEWRVSEIHVLE